MNKYRIATYEEKQSYHDYGCDPCYSLLLGPNGFECLLTEPEDRNWERDGRTVVDELNRLLEENLTLKKTIDNIRHLALYEV